MHSQIPQNACPLTPPDDPEIQAWVRLAHGYHQIARRLEQALDEHSLSLAQFEVLARVHFDSGMTQSELASRLLVSKGNICGLLDRMTAADLVQRQTDSEDRRVNRLSLTKGGKDLLAITLPVHLSIIKEMMSVLSPPELGALHTSLEKLSPEAAC